MNRLIRLLIVAGILLWLAGALPFGFLPESPLGTAIAEEDDEDEDDIMDELPEEYELVDPNERFYVESLEVEDGEFHLAVVPLTDGNVVVEYADYGAQVEGGEGIAPTPEMQSTTVSDRETVVIPAVDGEHGQIAHISIDGNGFIVFGESPADGMNFFETLEPEEAFLLGGVFAVIGLILAIWLKVKERFNEPRTSEQIARDNL